MRLTLFALILFNIPLVLAQNTPISLVPDVTVEHYLDIQPNVSRMVYDAVSDRLHYLTVDGDIYLIDHGPTGPMDTLLFTNADHGITNAQGMVFHDSALFISGNISNGNYWEGVVARGSLLPDGLRQWNELARTEPYARGGKDHGFNGLAVSPDGNSLFVNSGSRTDHGEVQDMGGVFPDMREEPVSAIVLILPINGVDIVIPNDIGTLSTSGMLYAQGVRNTYDLAFNSAGHLFGVENSGDHDDPEEMNWMRPGFHYGFPWRAGGNPNPTRAAGYDPTQDPLLNPGFPSAATEFNYDPLFPAPPNLIFEEPIVNHGPDADKIRTETGSIVDASDSGIPISTFTCHRSPLGLIFDNQNALGGDYTGDAFVASFTPGGDTTGFSPFAPWGIPVVPVDESGDLLHLELFYDVLEQEYSVSAQRIVKGFYLPVDAEQVGNEIFVIEYWINTPRSLWVITLPGAVSVSENDRMNLSISLFPNPANDVLQWRLDQGSVSSVEILSIQGQVLNSYRISGKTGSLDTSGLNDGSYFVRFLVDDGWVTRPFMVVR
ncbi:MAG: T9SS type A sorting domain-containing protein [Flavobacteriales bacterium]|nr:T9SS type A sorting domain-containing protein [Flavobacteriales bacterium]MBK7239147.1 T9SS type A sorting domain-containing protein [Flavobacteriales bacterium]MBK7296663.1 T9SS type A sorting domain-containing protein [Flavobacteriales bacterium]MBK9536746.1 T9SS type A sorting domain-containing protein [Flavobacteriales bacterium]MBP9138226.1 T9SS type A sorting domain-containing protein [Flavobacteriales bacterium]